MAFYSFTGHVYINGWHCKCSYIPCSGANFWGYGSHFGWSECWDWIYVLTFCKPLQIAAVYNVDQIWWRLGLGLSTLASRGITVRKEASVSIFHARNLGEDNNSIILRRWLKEAGNYDMGTLRYHKWRLDRYVCS